MRVIFTRSNKIGSRIIRLVTGEPVSHVAIGFTSTMDMVAGMTFSGLTIESSEKFLAAHEIYAAYTVDAPTLIVWDRIKSQIPRGYDFPGMIWLGLAILCRRAFGFKIKRNPWNKKDLSFCTEFADMVLGTEDGAIVTPGELLAKLEQADNAI